MFVTVKLKKSQTQLHFYKMSLSLLNDTSVPDSKEMSDKLMFIIEGILLGIVACFGIAGKLSGLPPLL